MEVLWSPWRSKYIERFKDEKNSDCPECFLCEALQMEDNDEENLIVYKGKSCFAILNKFPYNNGHLLISPFRHVSEYEDLTDEELLEIMQTLRKCLAILKEAYKPHGYNVGINIGRVAGAGLPGHIHFHIVPRWNGDTSFTAVLSDIKVVSQALFDTKSQFRELFSKL